MRSGFNFRNSVLKLAFGMQALTFKRLGFCLLFAISVIAPACESDLARRVGKYEQTRDYESATQFLQRATRNNPQDAEAHFLLGRVQMQQGAYEDAVAALETSEEISPRFEEQIEFLREKYGREEFQEGKRASQSESYQAAIRHYRSATLLLSDDATAHRALGHALVQADQPIEAERAYQGALELQPNAEALNNLAALAFQRDAYSEVVQYSRRALDIDTDAARKSRSEVTKRLAYAHLQLGDFTAARERFGEALNLAPSTELRRDFAFALYQQGEYDEARSQLEELASADELDSSGLHILGDTYLSLGRHQEAAETYLRLRERDPEDKDALQGLVIAYENLDREEEAQKYIDQISDLTDGAN